MAALTPTPHPVLNLSPPYMLVHLCSPPAAAAAYWESVPSPVLWPVVVLATAAAIIASQALITGAFSIVQQVRVAQVLGSAGAGFRGAGGHRRADKHGVAV